MALVVFWCRCLISVESSRSVCAYGPRAMTVSPRGQISRRVSVEHPLSEAFSPFLQRVMANPRPASGPGWRSQACVSAAWFQVRSWSGLRGRENFKRAVGRELQVGAGRGGGLAKPESPRNHMQVSNTCPELCCSLHMPRWNDTNLYTDV